MNKLFLILLLIGFSSCASTSAYKSLTAGEIGCLPEEIELVGTKKFVMGGVDPWVAKCKGKEFICSPAGNKVSCKERLN